MAVLYVRAGRLTAKNGGFRPGQRRERLHHRRERHHRAPAEQLDGHVRGLCRRDAAAARLERNPAVPRDRAPRDDGLSIYLY